MRKVILIIALALISMNVWSDFSCPDGANAVCLDNGDTVCSASAKCVDNDVICIDKHDCDPGIGYICESEYDEMLSDYKKTVAQHNELASENVDLRVLRLEQKNCVLNASTLEVAQSCVR